jgi:hypothetical protein
MRVMRCNGKVTSMTGWPVSQPRLSRKSQPGVFGDWIESIASAGISINWGAAFPEIATGIDALIDRSTGGGVRSDWRGRKGLACTAGHRLTSSNLRHLMPQTSALGVDVSLPEVTELQRSSRPPHNEPHREKRISVFVHDHDTQTPRHSMERHRLVFSKGRSWLSVHGTPRRVYIRSSLSLFEQRVRN